MRKYYQNGTGAFNGNGGSGSGSGAQHEPSCSSNTTEQENRWQAMVQHMGAFKILDSCVSQYREAKSGGNIKRGAAA